MTVNSGDTAFVVAAAALVFIMTPGLGFFYGGMARAKHAQATLMTSILAIAVISVQWFFWGYSLVFSTSGGSFIGDLKHIVLRGVDDDPHPLAPNIPENCYMFYQLMFAIITPALAFGAAAERASIESFLLFLFAWSTLVYDFVACWTWGPNGWLNIKIKAYDFAGGGPVHIASGFAALAYCLLVGKRTGYGTTEFKPHSLSNVVLGTALLWFGWFGFNGGSELAADARAINACVVTNLAACVAGLSWMLVEFIGKRKLSSFGFCCGAVAGLVGITPAAGFVSPASSLVFGVVTGVGCFYACRIKVRAGFDDAFDVFGVHGVGGVIGGLLTGIFAEKRIAKLGGAEIAGGWLDHNYDQLGRQIIAILCIAAWSFVMSTIILKGLDVLPWIGIRVPKDEETLGDIAIIGETAWAWSSDHDVNDARGFFTQAKQPGENKDALQLTERRTSKTDESTS
jgi:Amt family ammonium transporter